MAFAPLVALLFPHLLSRDPNSAFNIVWIDHFGTRSPNILTKRRTRSLITSWMCQALIRYEIRIYCRRESVPSDRGKLEHQSMSWRLVHHGANLRYAAGVAGACGLRELNTAYQQDPIACSLAGLRSHVALLYCSSPRLQEPSVLFDGQYLQ